MLDQVVRVGRVGTRALGGAVDVLYPNLRFSLHIPQPLLPPHLSTDPLLQLDQCSSHPHPHEDPEKTFPALTFRISKGGPRRGEQTAGLTVAEAKRERGRECL